VKTCQTIHLVLRFEPIGARQIAVLAAMARLRAMTTGTLQFPCYQNPLASLPDNLRHFDIFFSLISFSSLPFIPALRFLPILRWAGFGQIAHPLRLLRLWRRTQCHEATQSHQYAQDPSDKPTRLTHFSQHVRCTRRRPRPSKQKYPPAHVPTSLQRPRPMPRPRRRPKPQSKASSHVSIL